MKKFLLFLFFLFIPFSLSAQDKIEINTATQEELEKLIGIGPVKAKAIIKARPFSSLDDLLRVKGIGEKTLEKIKEQGLAYVEKAQPQIQAKPTNTISPVIKQTPSPSPIFSENIQTKNQGQFSFLPPTPQPSPPSFFPKNIIFNEILPSPSGPDSENEWIEIFNPNNFDVDLTGWKIKDNEGKTTEFILPQGTKIPARGFLVLKRPETKITLNNSGDRLELLSPASEIIDSVSFKNAPRAKSYNRTSSGWNWSLNLTPGKKNVISSFSPSALQKPTDEKNNSDKRKTEDKSSLLKKQTAEIGKNIIRTNRPFPVFLIAFVLATFSGIIIVLLKRGLI